MRRQFPGEGLWRRCRPGVEGLETRDLLSHVIPRPRTSRRASAKPRRHPAVGSVALRTEFADPDDPHSRRGAPADLRGALDRSVHGRTAPISPTGRARFTPTASREDPTSSSRASSRSRSFRRLIPTQHRLPAIRMPIS